MALCVFLLCVLESVLGQFHRFAEGRNPRRLVTRNGVSVMSSLPLTYGPRIRSVPGVTHVAATLMFGGVLPARREGRAVGGTDWTSVFPNQAVEAEPYFAMSPEYLVPPYQYRAFLGDLRACLIGRQLAEKFSWKVGDRFHLESVVGTLRKSSGPFEFVVRGIYDVDLEAFPGTESNIMFFHFRYLDESFGGMTRGHLFTVGIEDPRRAADIAGAIDALFENAADQTLTETEKAFTAGFLSMAVDLGAVVHGIGLAVCFTILLVTANTMGMAVRERHAEVAVLRTVGFTSARVLGLVVAEGALLGALGGALGLAGAQAALHALSGARGRTLLGLTQVELTPSAAAMGAGIALLLGMAAGFVPGWRACRTRVTVLLRKL
jgi:putative ABC transport system permease protein